MNVISKNVFLKYLFIVILFVNCENNTELIDEKEYSRHVGDISFDAKIDQVDFRICNGEENILQYFNLGEGPVYTGEKSSFSEILRVNFKSNIDKSQNGLVRIRFIVNCQGEADRFRVLQADSNYQETNFDITITSQLLEITSGIEKWVVLYDENKQPVDYYNYLIFRITNGQITEILP